MAKINEYPQAVSINNNDLFVIDQESGGDHATKSASVSQIADKVTDGLTANDIPLTSSDPTPTATAIGDLSSLTTTVKSSLVVAVNEVNGKTTSTNTTVDIGSYGDDIQLCKSGKVVLMIINPLSTLPSGGWTQIGTLPNGYEPIIQVISDMYSRDDRHLRIRLDQDKKIYVYNYSSAISSTNNAYWNITYITA